MTKELPKWTQRDEALSHINKAIAALITVPDYASVHELAVLAVRIQQDKARSKA